MAPLIEDGLDVSERLYGESGLWPLCSVKDFTQGEKSWAGSSGVLGAGFPIACDHNSVHHALLTVIRNGEVLRASIVPDGDGARCPLEADLDLGGRNPGEEECKQSITLCLSHAIDARREIRVYVELFASGLRVTADDRGSASVIARELRRGSRPSVHPQSHGSMDR